jgi:pimeloyl-ACP methyl ester carboxylesterase
VAGFPASYAKGGRKLNIVVKIIGWLLVLYIMYCGFLFLMQRQMMFPRNMIEGFSTPVNHITGLERIWVATGFGKIETWFLPPATNMRPGPAPVVIFGHGNAELIDFWPAEFKTFTQLGMGVLLVEYPGYGRSEGSPSQQSISEAFVSAYDVLVARKDVDPTRIILFGRSLGGAAVCRLAAERPSAALILMSTFSSARSFAAKYWVPGFLVRDPFDNLAVVKTYPAPVLVIHGKHDDIIPQSHGVALYQTAPQAKMIIYDSGHNDCPPDWNVFWRDVETFLKKAGLIGN